MKITQLEFGKGKPGIKRQLAQARHAASYFGAEAVANNDGLSSYKEDIAIRYGYKSWKELPGLIRRDAMEHYMAGRRAERQMG
jgi:acyl-CoA-binding protein